MPSRQLHDKVWTLLEDWWATFGILGYNFYRLQRLIKDYITKDEHADWFRSVLPASLLQLLSEAADNHTIGHLAIEPISFEPPDPSPLNDKLWARNPNILYVTGPHSNINPVKNVDLPPPPWALQNNASA